MAAITPALYRRHNDAWWEGRRVRLLRNVELGSGMILPAGMEMTVTRKMGGLSVRGDPCKCCGVTPRCHRLDIGALELIEEGTI